MRLSVSLLLITLALCCYEANSSVCPALTTELTGFLLASDVLFELQIGKFNAPAEAVEAKMNVKKCISEISSGRILLIEAILGQILAKCSANDNANI
ncbi:secretoglobin family 1D member 1-like [Lepus europaeus]|uniref:secretoglobin family 1D member 1-like n=1 Tax=Lepus europaeus TaxID=9983 RepID=UPI002B48C6F9|nr:secretoglobin family 1D member 1-like [Lepus europaeus]